MKRNLGSILAGTLAGAINGLLGAGGGMILVPLLALFNIIESRQVFTTSVAIILPICFVSMSIHPGLVNLPWTNAWPYLLGGAAGGILAGILSKEIPVKWLHRGLGLMILYGGIRYLC